LKSVAVFEGCCVSEIADKRYCVWCCSAEKFACI